MESGPQAPVKKRGYSADEKGSMSKEREMPGRHHESILSSGEPNCQAFSTQQKLDLWAMTKKRYQNAPPMTT